MEKGGERNWKSQNEKGGRRKLKKLRRRKGGEGNWKSWERGKKEIEGQDEKVGEKEIEKVEMKEVGQRKLRPRRGRRDNKADTKRWNKKCWKVGKERKTSAVRKDKKKEISKIDEGGRKDNQQKDRKEGKRTRLRRKIRWRKKDSNQQEECSRRIAGYGARKRKNIEKRKSPSSISSLSPHSSDVMFSSHLLVLKGSVT